MSGFTSTALLLLASVSNTAHAFSLEDHIAITTQAVEELQYCVSARAFNGPGLHQLVSGNLDEDINIFAKWWRYSHYFNPEKKLDMRRDDSSVRMRILLNELQGMSAHASDQDLAEQAGHVLHHFQDVASPPHVLPVNHWLTDRFESFEEGIVPFVTQAEFNCEGLRIASTADPMSLFVETARQTLRNARGEFQVLRNNSPIAISWEYFWQAGPGNNFGSYGYLGNRFGKESIRQRASHYEISRSAYQQMKRQQIRLGVQTTKKALLWMFDHGYLR